MARPQSQTPPSSPMGSQWCDPNWGPLHSHPPLWGGMAAERPLPPVAPSHCPERAQPGWGSPGGGPNGAVPMGVPPLYHCGPPIGDPHRYPYGVPKEWPQSETPPPTLLWGSNSAPPMGDPPPPPLWGSNSAAPIGDTPPPHSYGVLTVRPYQRPPHTPMGFLRCCPNHRPPPTPLWDPTGAAPIGDPPTTTPMGF